MTATPKPLILIILDGSGYSESPDHNAIYAVKKSVWNRLLATQPYGLISGSGMDAGPSDGQIGNSEVGRMNPGADRVVCRDFTRVTEAIHSGEFFKNPMIAGVADRTAAADKAMYILGLLPPGGVHSHEDHLVAMVQMIVRCGAGKTYLHTFLDGHDTPSKSAQLSLERLDAIFAGPGKGYIASIISRYFTMSCNSRRDRVQVAYEPTIDGKAESIADSSVAALEAAYTYDESDELVEATAVAPADTRAVRAESGNVAIFMDFRVDRVRELSRAFVEPTFNEFSHERVPQPAGSVMLTQYVASAPVPCAFPPKPPTNVLGEYLVKHGKTQLRITETEKYVHVTLFFSGGRGEPYEGEEHILIPPPKVATYNLQPEVSAPGVTDRIVEAIGQQRRDAVAADYINGDMVGHTGMFEATIKAVECLDTYMGCTIEVLDKIGGEALTTVNHGNVEQVEDESTDQTYTVYTYEPVPFACVGKHKLSTCEGGMLTDMAPIMLVFMGLEQPTEMTGRSIAILGRPADDELPHRADNRITAIHRFCRPPTENACDVVCRSGPDVAPCLLDTTLPALTLPIDRQV